MNQPKGAKPKHIPQRTCIACRKVEGKRTLIRLVRSEEKVEIDPTGKKAGRGAYLCANRQCWQIVLKGNRLDQVLRTKLSVTNKQELQTFMVTLPEVETID